MDSSESPVLLTEVLTEHDAILLRDALAEQGIRAVYNGAAIAGFRAETPAMVRVLVSESDLARATELMAELKLGAPAEIDWSQVDVGRPEDPA